MSQLTSENLQFIFDKADSIGKFDDSGLDIDPLRDMIYRLGCYVYRQHHGVGHAADDRFPRLEDPKRVYSEDQIKYVPKAELAVA